jgi:hypothetical protein
MQTQRDTSLAIGSPTLAANRSEGNAEGWKGTV